MGLIITDDTYYGDIADAIRSKAGGSDTYTPADMAAAIEALPSGGGGGKFVERISANASSPYDVTAADLTGATRIKPSAFYMDKALRNIVVPSTVTELGKFAFTYSSVASATFQGTIATFDDASSFGGMGVFGGSGLNEIDIAVRAGINNDIFSGMFSNCSHLTTAKITILGQSASFTNLNSTFNGCTTLSNVQIVSADNEMRINSSCFTSCYQLQRLVFPDTLTEISSISNFNDCNNLAYLDLGAGCHSCGGPYMQFGNTMTGVYSQTGLKVAIRYNQGVFIVNSDKFFGYDNTSKPSNFAGFYVPDALVDSYKAANYWTTWASYIHPLSDLDE